MIDLKSKTLQKSVNTDIQKYRDAGMAFTLISLILAYFLNSEHLILLSIFLLIIDMTIPSIFKPFSKVWFGFSLIIGTFISKIILTVIFYLMVTPVGLIRRLLHKDRLLINSWKKSSHSVFIVRNHHFTKKDISKPY